MSGRRSPSLVRESTQKPPRAGRAVHFRPHPEGLTFMLSSESQPGDVMESNPQSLCSPFPCTAANGRRGPKQLASSPEIGDARPKPPVKPKPCVLPKPAMPVKPVPGQRQALSEVPSAEKINLLAGPKPYSGGAGNAVKRLSFGLKTSPRETTNGKEVLYPFSTTAKPAGDGEGTGPANKSSAVEGASGEERGESSSVRKGAVPFKVMPVSVAAKPERFPGTTVEEILAKMEKPNKEGASSPDRPRLVRSFFSQDGSTAVHRGPKSFAAFRRCSSGEGGETESEGPACRASCEVEDSILSRNKEEIASSNGQHLPESELPARATERNLDLLSKDSSSQPSMSCDGGQPGYSSLLSPPGVSLPKTYQLLTKLSSRVTPGSPDAPAESAQSPESPHFPADVPSTEAQLPPGSPDVPAEPLRSPVEVSLGHAQAPGSPVALSDPCPPGSPSGFLGHSLSSGLGGLSARCAEVSLPPGPSASLTHPPAEHSLAPPCGLHGVSESPGSPSTPSEYLASSDKPPGSPSHAQASPLPSRDKDSLDNQAPTLPLEGKDPQLSQLVLRRASEGVLQPRGKKMDKEELGGSLAALPRGGDPALEQAAGGESNWSLSQSFEWSFPNRALEFGGRRLGSPPRSPIEEAEAELDRDSLSPKGSYEERGSEGQRGEETEAYGSFLCHSNSRSSPGSRRKAEDQLDPSALEISAPGGPSTLREPISPKLKGPIAAAEVGCQEEHDGSLPFVPTPEEGALRAMEPLPSVEQAAPPAEPCILFSEDVQVQTAASCQEVDGAVGLAREGKLRVADPERRADPDPGSHWLDELLASPPPSADDIKKRSTPKSEDPTGPEDLLGWSRKDLHSEFGFVEVDRSASFGMGWAAGVGKVVWPGETEQDQEFGTGPQEWLSSYSDAKRQDMEFGSSQKVWTRGTPLQDSSNPGQEDWITAYGSSCGDQKIEEPDWSSTYSISTAECQDREPYVRKPGWPKLCSNEDDQESSKSAAEKMDWSSPYHVGATERTDWPNKYSEEKDSCPELEVNTKSSNEFSKYSTHSHQDTELSARRLEGPSDHSAVNVGSQDATSSASQSSWPSDSNVDSRASPVQSESHANQVEQTSEYRANHPESQVSIQQRLRPNTYGFDDDSCQESELSVKQSDWPSRYDMGIPQSHDGVFGAEKPDGASEYDDNQTRWERELSIASRSSTTEFEAGDLEYCARKPVWADDYNLRESDLQDSDFHIATREWVRDNDLSATKQNNQLGAIGKDRAGSFGPLELPSLSVTVDLEETAGSLVGQGRDLIAVAMDEPRGVGEGQPEWTQDLGLRGMDLSNDLKVGSPDASENPTEKQLHWFPSLGLETLSASSDVRTVNPEETREPGVGQADLAYRSGAESMEVSDLRPKALDGAEEVDLIQMDWTGATGIKHKDSSYQFGATPFDGDEMEHPRVAGVSGESRRFRSERLSSPSCLQEDMVSNSAVKEVAQQKRPASFHSCHSEEERILRSLRNNQGALAERAEGLPFSAKEDGKALSAADGGDSQLDSGNGSQLPVDLQVLNHPEQNGSQAAQPISQKAPASEGAIAAEGENFIFLEDTEVLDNTVYRDRVNLGRKRGHRAPATRSGGALSENDGDNWMFRDSTEPRIASAVSDEDAPEEPRSRKSRTSPLSKGVKVPLFPGLNPSALKAKLRGRNRSAEEGDPQSEAKETHVQRSKSCKIANITGKPLVLPPKPEKSSGSETSSPNWLQVLKLKKKKS
ncbi:182 kDa tankyrase-1-binding protein isoform X3 [Zootoca vivipara]|uniref:182 kDa tankyrase-1-binding protein isoform X3 n=1 Tax=Zootoca vivipara TaxID=8524 RepID=UPI0015916810|nr:182 kDa tankyrase-1-binding protein isoform X3 [Zootoca vivipara]